MADLRPAVEALRRVDDTRLPRAFDLLPTPPPDLGDRIMASVGAHRPEHGRRLGRHTGLLAAAAAVVVALGVGFGSGWVAAPGPPLRPLEPVAVAAGAGLDVDAALVPHTWGMEVELSGSGFDQGDTYRVVVLDRAGQEYPAGEFLGTGADEMICQLNSSVLRGDAVAFSVRDAAGEEVVRSDFA